MTHPDQTSAGDTSAADKRRATRAIIAIIIAIAALAFVFSNVAPATLRFLFMEFTMPAWAWFLAVLLAGVVIGSLFPWFRPKKKR
ncbi:LapA family protein [Leucobacter rhizosphaerae]|uniref:LapA family protein n=1 Tax=Leucobacter rhizosphaerae TaxID=2932245 RepID=A0ABY4FT08_9MICO|nr:LapA family protein [Leucobacter rhizosphaerae]UOQ59428.1 LapA family protein [Leucobacter rhizosphaerae]